MRNTNNDPRYRHNRDGNRLRAIERVARTLIEQHLPGQGIKFQFTRTKRAIGYCRFLRGGKYGSTPVPVSIGLSKHWAQVMKPEEIVDTILHEIAHALAGTDAGHGPEWKAIARRIGAKPEACLDITALNKRVQSKYTLTCPHCDNTYSLHRMLKNRHYRCGDCKTRLVIKQNY